MVSVQDSDGLTERDRGAVSVRDGVAPDRERESEPDGENVGFAVGVGFVKVGVTLADGLISCDRDAVEDDVKLRVGLTVADFGDPESE